MGLDKEAPGTSSCPALDPAGQCSYRRTPQPIRAINPNQSPVRAESGRRSGTAVMPPIESLVLEQVLVCLSVTSTSKNTLESNTVIHPTICAELMQRRNPLPQFQSSLYFALKRSTMATDSSDPGPPPPTTTTTTTTTATTSPSDPPTPAPQKGSAPFE